MSLKIDRVQLEIIVQQDSARQQMIELEKQMRNASRELSKLKKQFGENSEQYKAQAAVVRNLKQQYDDLFNEIGIGHLSLKELANRQRELNAILRNIDPSLPEWKQYNQQLKEVNARIKELKGTATETGLSLGKLADGFNRYAAIGASALATLTGMTLTMRKCVDEYAQMEEAESQVIKYTGMTAEEVKQLNEEFKAMDTRTPREELNRLAGEAGKLGITGVQEVREFVEAANQINVALGEDLGEEAVNQIGKLSQMFGDESRSLKDNMLAIGSAVNQVAQSTSASEPYLVQFTARMGGVGKQAKMSVTDIMGFASALDQNMLRSEMASTALSGLIMRIYQEPAKYAKLAGMDVEQFTQLVETDVNEAVMSFLSALNKMGGMAQMAPVLKEMQLSGAEAASVISTLAGNVDLVRKEQENANVAFTEGTSITNEYAVQNNTVQARLEKLQNDFKNVRVELGERLLPVMRYMISTGSLTVKGLMAIINAVSEYKGILITLVAGIGSYVAAAKLATLWKQREVVAIAAYNAGAKLQIAMDMANRSSKLLWAAATATLTGNLQRAARAMRGLNLIFKASPWGAVISLVTTLGVGLYQLLGHTDKVTESFQKMNEELGQEQTALNHLFTSLQEAGDGTERRRQLIEEINQRYGTYLPNLLTEKSSLDEIKAAYDRINTAMTQQIALKHRNEAINTATEEAASGQMDTLESLRQSVADKTGDEKVAARFIQDLREMANAATQMGTDYRKSVANAMTTLENLYLGGKKLTGGMKSDIQDFMNNVYQLELTIDDINEKYEGWMPKQNDSITPGTLPELNVTGTRQPGGGGTGDGEDALAAAEANLTRQLQLAQNAAKQKLEIKIREGQDLEQAQAEYEQVLYDAQKKYLAERIKLWADNKKDTTELQGQFYDLLIKEATEAYEKEKALQEQTRQTKFDNLEAEELNDRRAAKQAFIDGTLQDEEAYRNELLRIERLYLNKRKALLVEYGMDTTEVDDQLLNMDFSKTQGENRQAARDKQAARNEGFRNIREADTFGQKNDILQQMYEADLISYEEYQDEKTRLAEEQEQYRMQIASNAINAVSQLSSAASQLFSTMESRETQQVTARYDKEIEKARKAGKDTTKLEEEKEAAILAIKKKYADKQFAAQILQIISSTALGIMQCYAQMGPILGTVFAAVVAAQGAMQLATAKAQRDEAKGLKSGGYSRDYIEGYTTRGNPDETAGFIPVHKNEFVANHEAVANPDVKQFLDVFDVAQKRGTIRMLNTTQILEQIRTRGGRYSGGYTAENAGASRSSASPLPGFTAEQRSQVVLLLEENNRLLTVLTQKELVVDPRKVRDSINHINQLEKNVSR